MAKNQSTTSPREELIPSYVRDRDGIAARAGLEVHVTIDDARVRSTWFGSSAQFQATGAQFEERLWGMKREGYCRQGALRGRMRREGSDQYSFVMQECLPLRQWTWRGLSVIQYEPWGDTYISIMSYHGTVEELHAAGIPVTRAQAPHGIAQGKRNRWHTSGCVGDEFAWEASRCLDGKIIFEKREFSAATRLSRARHSAARKSLQTGVFDKVERALERRSSALARGDDAFQVFLRNMIGDAGTNCS